MNWLRARHAVSWILLACTIAALLTAAAWRLDGGRWEYVDSPSMGTVAPVGTLLWIKPARFSSLQVGDFITFHPPGRSDVTYSHRVHAVHPDATISTKGVIGAPDPWRLRAADIVGRVVMHWWGVGWLIKAAPMLILGALLLAAVIRSQSAWETRLTTGIVGVALLLSIAIGVYRPLIGAEELSFRYDDDGARATFVSTGLLPVHIQAHRGEHVILHDGEVGSVHVTRVDDARRFHVDLRPQIPFWWWTVLVLACFAPALWVLAVGVPRDAVEGQ